MTQIARIPIKPGLSIDTFSKYLINYPENSSVKVEIFTRHNFELYNQ